MKLTQAAILLAIIPAMAGCSTTPMTYEEQVALQQMMNSTAQWSAGMAAQSQQTLNQAQTYQAPVATNPQQPSATALVYCRELGTYAITCKDLTN